MDRRLEADVCVIGAGSGGLSAASGSAQLGLKTVLIEGGHMGGDCLNTGCVPSKSLIAAAEAAHAFTASQALGIGAQTPSVDFSAVRRHVRDVIAGIAPNDSQERFENLGVQVIRDYARFTSRETLEAGGLVIKARWFVIATGSRPVIPAIPGLEADRILTNESVFALESLPGHLLVIGGGPIGMEMAQAFRRLGSAVTVLTQGEILSREDPDAADLVRRSLISDGVRLFEGTHPVSVEHAKGGVTVLAKHDGKQTSFSGSHLLVAAGRQPNIAGLGLEAAGVAYGRAVKVDRHMRTTNPRIYAIGDAAGEPFFTHAAGYEAGIFIQHALFRNPLAKADYRALPRVTYTDPELAHVGLSEEEARRRHGNHARAVISHFAENDRARAGRRAEGLLKLVIVKGRPVGATIAGPGAGELLPLWTLAIKENMPLSRIAGMVIAYPTLSEIGKHAAGSYFRPLLFSDRVRRIVRLLRKLP